MADASEVLEKVRKLLRQAEDRAATPEEAEAFSAKAEELMIRHAIDQAMLDETDPARRDRIVTRTITLVNPHLDYKGRMLYQLAKALGVRGAYGRKNARRTHPTKAGWTELYSTMSLVGFETDVDWVETLFTSLDLQRLNALRAAITAQKPGYEHGRTFSKAFNEGFREMTVARVKATRAHTVAQAVADAPAAGRSVALVLVAREQQVDDEFRKAFPWARERRRSVSLSSASGYESGRVAGSSASIARGSVGGIRRELS